MRPVRKRLRGAHVRCFTPRCALASERLRLSGEPQSSPRHSSRTTYGTYVSAREREVRLVGVRPQPASEVAVAPPMNPADHSDDRWSEGPASCQTASAPNSRLRLYAGCAGVPRARCACKQLQEQNNAEPTEPDATEAKHTAHHCPVRQRYGLLATTYLVRAI